MDTKTPHPSRRVRQPGSMQRMIRQFGLAWFAAWLLVAGSFLGRTVAHQDGPAALAIAAPAATDRIGSGCRQALEPIERIRVGQRVAFALNPLEGFDRSLGFEIHPAVWRKITLRPDEKTHVVLLRPTHRRPIAPQSAAEHANPRVAPAGLMRRHDERLDAESDVLWLTVPEVGIDGPARVESIEWPHARLPTMAQSAWWNA